ncbi:MAG: hypothetical protein E6L08_07120 [Verrucomicrobia bacterium]|nr:MAG: hypothetical protein E6L08_07120 [Verrucomicrobiota bacterium]
MKTTFASIRKSRNPAIGGFLLLLPLVCFGLAPMAKAVGPDTDGAIAGSNNGEGIGVLVSRTSGIWNTGTGFEALNHLTAGQQNTATGLRALNNDINGGYNTATGVLSLFSNTSGFFNSATGAYSLANNTTGLRNTALGYAALYRNAGGEDNTAVGFAALYHNSVFASSNCAFGKSALFNNLKAETNNAFGVEALYNNLTGEPNNAFGTGALFANTEGSSNNAFGHDALRNNVDGEWNNAFGFEALKTNVSGSFNTAIGDSAGFDITGDGNVCIGEGVLGQTGVNDSTYIRNINTTAQPIVAGVDGVTVDLTTGRLGHGVSSRRYKEQIKPMDKASEMLFALKPVTYRYKKEIDPKQTLDFGLIAEEVAKVSPELAIRDAKGQVANVRYNAINAMLLNEFLKEHQQVVEQQATIAELKSTVAQQQKGMDVLTAQLNEQATQIQKVSAQIEMSRPVPKVVLNNQ